MIDRPKQPESIARELREAEALEAGLTRLLGSIQPPAGAAERLLAQLDDVHAGFHESQLTLDAGAPYSFEEALKIQQAQQAHDHEGADLLAAGLETEPEEEPIDEAELDPDDEA